MRQRRRFLEQFVEAIGKTRITELRVEHLAHYMPCLACLPIRYNESPADRQLTLEQHMECGDDLPPAEAGLAGNTINRNLTFISTLLNHAKREGLHPAESLDLTLCRDATEDARAGSKAGFISADVAQVFEHPTWHRRQSPGRPHTAGDVVVKDSRYWAPLLVV